MEEPSVLDYVKSKLMFWRRNRDIIEFPLLDLVTQATFLNSQTQTIVQPIISVAQPTIMWSWRAIIALLFALIAQSLLEPTGRQLFAGITFYVFSGAMLIWSIIQKEWNISPIPNNCEDVPVIKKPNGKLLLLSVPVIIISFLSFSENEFTIINIIIWLFLILLCLRIFWTPEVITTIIPWYKKIYLYFKNFELNIRFTRWNILFIFCIIVVMFFRFFHLDLTPGEMFSDHAEKLLDVGNILNGQTPIFFPRNTGREAIQMYLTAFIATIFGTGLSFISLKIGTAIAGFLTLPYVYFLGKRIANKWVGLLAFILTGVAYWPNIISRVGLRFPLYPLFVAPVLFYLIRGLQRSNRNDFIISGIALGFGLHGYSPIRIMPFVVALIIAIYFLHPESSGKKKNVLLSFVVLGFFAFILFLPLLRYWTEFPDIFGYRAFTRLSTTERIFPAPVWIIFLSNLWNALVMFFWKNGEIWVHSIPGRPALDVVTAALFFCGIILIAVRYIRKRNWVDLSLLLLVPLLMMPSILSLAFPDENPSLNRTGGAIVPVFIISAIALEGLLSSLIRKASSIPGKMISGLIGVLLLAISLFQNYSLVFNEYHNQFLAGAWNTSEIGHIIRGFSDSVGSKDSAYVVPYPYWVDTRLVGITAGYPEKDYALWPENFKETLVENGAKLFILKSEDAQDEQKLIELYPKGILTLHPTTLEGKDFYEFYVPPQ